MKINKKTIFYCVFSLVILSLSALMPYRYIGPIACTLWIIIVIVNYGARGGILFAVLMAITSSTGFSSSSEIDNTLTVAGILTYFSMSIGIGIPIDIIKKEKLKRVANEEQLRRITDNIQDIIIQIDKDGTIKYISQSCKRILGFSKEDIIGNKIYDGVYKDDIIGFQNSIMNSIRDRNFYPLEYRYNKKDGQIVWLESLGQVIVGDVNDDLSIIMNCRDITLKKEIEVTLEESQNRWKFALEGSGDGVMDLNLVTGEAFYSPQWKRLFGYEEDEIGSSRDELISRIHPDDIDKVIESREMHLKSKIPLHDVEYRVRCNDGSYKWVLARGKVIRCDEDGTPVRIIGTFTDITDRKFSEDKIKYLSYHDTLTGVYNRAFFDEELSRLYNEKVTPLSIIIGDVNGLKLTNDVFGHLEGDNLLIKLAKVLKDSCREEDIVARWGGDEFAILLPGVCEDEATRIMYHIIDTCDSLQSDPIKLSIALGISTKDSNKDDAKDLIKAAEEMMYRHKLLESKSVRNNLISSLQNTLFERSYETREHADRLVEMGQRLGEEIGLTDTEQDELDLLSLLHDIGKIAIRDDILGKPEMLSEDEWNEMKKHSEIGYRIAQTTQELFHIAEYILSHHECWDGTGYPRGLKGLEIPKLSRIIAVIDSYDVMTNARVYKEPIKSINALEEIKRCAGTQFDPDIVNAFSIMMQLSLGEAS